MKSLLCSVFSLMAVGLASPAAAQTVLVPGAANPFLAGQPSGTTCCSGDVAPGQSPVLAASVAGGQTLSIVATGNVDHGGGSPAGADGDNNGTTYTYRFDMTADYGTGISGPAGVNIDGLVGVFLTAATPGGTAPAALNFAAAGSSTGLDFLTLAPGLNQIFWIGDGLTGIGSGTLQRFIVPTGATRLFLGTADGYNWANNGGAITATVRVAAGAAVPEPATWGLMVLGFGVAGAAMRRRASRAACPA